MRRSKPVCNGAGDRLLRRMLLVSPAFVTIFFCLWTAYTSLLPLSSTGIHSKDCSKEVVDLHDAVACVDGPLQAAGGANTPTFTLAHEISQVRLDLLPDLPRLKLEKGTPSTLVPSKPFLSVDVEGNSVGDLDNQDVYDGIPPSNPSVATPADNSPTLEGPAVSGRASNVGYKSQHRPNKDETTRFAVEEVLMKVMENLRRFVVHPGSYVRNESFRATSVHRPESDSASCEGKHIFIYNLPTKFNVDLLGSCSNLIPWQNMCHFLSNSGMGSLTEDPSSEEGGEEVLVPPSLWYQTHQYSLEVIFHERLKHYKCLTASADLADMFYIPYYGGMDVLRWHFLENATSAERDQLGLELIKWLKEQPSWRKHEGADHVLVLGKITWDFRRFDGQAMWGSRLLLQEEMQNPTKLIIERDPWREHEVGVPHPTFFHPRHDRDIRTWQRHIDGLNRNHLVSFAGLPRPNQPESIRSQLIKQCLSGANDNEPNLGSSSCHFLNCGNFRCFHPKSTMDLFIHSEFCLQPSGDSPTRRSVFDSLIAGCIPVLFDPYTAYYQYPWHLPEDEKSYSVYFPADDVREGKINVIDELRKIPRGLRQEMRRRIIYEIMPGLLYARPDARLRDMDDAFILSLRGLFAKISDRLMTIRAAVQEQRR